MAKFKFYEVDKDYVAFLQKGDGKVPNIAYSTNDKFLCGILFQINNMSYYAPISSFNKQQKSNILIKNRAGKTLGSIRLSFMFPVPDEMLKVKDFSKEDPLYGRLLAEELDYCNRNADKIIDRAKYIYEAVTQSNDPLWQKICCNFKKLERLYDEYTPS